MSLNWRLTSPEIEHCINLTNPKIIFGSEDFVLTLNQKTKVEYVSFGPQYEKLFTNIFECGEAGLNDPKGTLKIATNNLIKELR